MITLYGRPLPLDTPPHLQLFFSMTLGKKFLIKKKNKRKRKKNTRWSSSHKLLFCACVFFWWRKQVFLAEKKFSYFYDMLKFVSTWNTYSYMSRECIQYGMSWLQIKARILFCIRKHKVCCENCKHTCTHAHEFYVLKNSYKVDYNMEKTVSMHFYY